MFGSELIRYYDDVFSDELCERLINIFTRRPETLIPIKMNGDLGGKVIELRIEDYKHDDTEFAEHDAIIRVIMDSLVDRYQDDIGMELKVVDEGYKIKHYYEGRGYYQPHVDNSQPHPRRAFSIVAYLQAPLEGGGTLFPIQNMRVDALKGRAVIFPSDWQYPHIPEQVTGSDKFALTCFYGAV